jgi:hypothetical protein
MPQLRLLSTSQRDLQPLVQAALQNELRLLEAGIRQTQTRLRLFEERYRMTTAMFIAQYEDDAFEETLDAIEWIGEYRLLQRLQEKAAILQDIRFAN